MPISWTAPHRENFGEGDPIVSIKKLTGILSPALNNAHVSGRYLGQVVPILCSHPVKRSRELSSGSGLKLLKQC